VLVFEVLLGNICFLKWFIFAYCTFLYFYRKFIQFNSSIFKNYSPQGLHLDLLKMKGKLYLIPNTLGDSPINNVIPPFNCNIINTINHYIVEDVRTARRFLSKCDIKTKIDDLQFYLLNKHTPFEEIIGFLAPLNEGQAVGIISEAGCPAIADPGAEVVRLAHEAEIEVIPLVGPSSILLALMASGFNGQRFAFNGYLPVKDAERNQQLKRDELRSKAEGQTQIYIETPYRNMQLLKAFIECLNPNTKLCIATDLSLGSEQIKTKVLKDWKSSKIDLNKRPSIFLFQA
jgi:16S rRNA (cytidine1402-2'-O)-methyltransferase